MDVKLGGFMKKIAFVIEDLSIKGGRETVLSTLANMLCHDYEVHVLCVTQQEKQIAYTLDNTIYYQYFTYYEGRIRDRFMRAVFKMKSYVRKNKIDLVLGIGSSTFMICSVICAFSKTKWIGCEHSNLKNMHYDPLERFSQKVGAKTCDLLVTLTKKDMLNWKELYHVSEKKMTYCYNPIKMIDTEKQYQLESKKILSIGRIVKVKQFHLIPQIASKVFEIYPDWSWDIYGSGDDTYIQKVKEEIKEYHLENHIHLMGNHPNPNEIYPQYGIFVLCSEFEGLPVVLLEAKLHHLPIVAFDCPTGPSEILEDGVSGELVEYNSITKMQDALIKLIENPTIRLEYSKHSQDNLHLFEEKNIVEKWKVLIENTLRR